MKKIYAHPNLSSLFDTECVWTTDINDIPNGCDIAAFSIFNCADFEKIVDQAMTKSKFVFIDFNELTELEMFSKANLLQQQHNNLQIVSTLISNLPSRIKFSGQWFMSPINFYSNNSDSAWSFDFLSKLTTEECTDRLYLFDCLLGIEKSSRNFIEQLYLDSSNRHCIFFSYFKDNINTGVWDFSVDLVGSSADLVSHNNNLFTPSAAIPYSIYNKSFYSIVAETVVFDQYNFYTEKIAKPILAKRPFIAFCGKHYLKNLKKLGFKTFGQIIDESYDEIDDWQQRFSLAWAQVEKLMQHDPKEIYQKTVHIRNHNYQLFRSRDWSDESKKIIANFLE